MKSIQLLAHEFGRIAGLGLAGVLAAAGAINTAVAEAPVSDTAELVAASPAPVADIMSSPPPLIVFSTPMPGYAVNSRFGFRRLPGEPGRMHEGVDFAAPSGQPIQCAAAGKVLRAGTSPSYGNFVEVDHGGGITTFYAHMSRRARTAVAGAPVVAGDTLGFVGSTGHSTGPHLHFELRKNERQFDPMRVLGRTFASLSDIQLSGPLRANRTNASASLPSGPVPYTRINGRVRSTIG